MARSKRHSGPWMRASLPGSKRWAEALPLLVSRKEAHGRTHREEGVYPPPRRADANRRSHGCAVGGWRAGGDVSDLPLRLRTHAARLWRLLPGSETRELGLQVQPWSEAARPLRLVLHLSRPTVVRTRA